MSENNMNAAIKTEKSVPLEEKVRVGKTDLLFEKILRFPALLALLVQATGLVTVGLFTWASYALTLSLFDVYFVFPVIVLVLLQAVLASGVATWIGMESWWRIIHFFFPVATYVMLMVDVPSDIYLLGFVVTLSIFWSTYRTRVPYYPSRLNVWEKVSNITHAYQIKKGTTDQPTRIIDIGSGLGGFSMHLANEHERAVVEGIELAPLPWITSRVSALLKRSKAVFRLGDYQKLDFSQYDIIFAYLSPAAMDNLWQKSQQEMREGCLLISLEFEVHGITPSKHISGEGQSPDIFVYQF